MAVHQKVLRQSPPYRYGAPNRYPDLHHPAQFRFTALEPGARRPLDLVTDCSWDDVNAILTGSITARDDVVGIKPQGLLNLGDRVLCEANIGGGFREVWTMRCSKPKATASNLERSFTLTSDLDLLNRSVDNLDYRMTRHHPKKWYAGEVILDVCAKYNIPVGKVAKGPGIPRVRVQNGTPLDVIRQVVKKVRRIYGIRWVIRFDHGALSVMPLTRSPDLLALGPTLIEAELNSDLPPEFASAVMMRARPDIVATGFSTTDKKGRTKRKPVKTHVLLESPASVRRFGYVRRVVVSPDANSPAEMRQQGMAWLAAVAKPLKTVTLTHQGMPFLRRGDAIQLAIGDWGMRRQIVFVNTIHHQVSAAGYRMTVQCIFDDPYIDRRGLSILYRLVSTGEEATGRYNALVKNMGAGSPAKNDTTAPGPFSAKDPSVGEVVPSFSPGDTGTTGQFG